MKTRLFLIPLLMLTALTGLDTPARAAATDDASEWLTRLYGIMDQGPFRMDYTLEFHGEQGGQPMSVEGSGHLLQNGPGYSVNDLSFEIGGMADQPAMTMNTRQVSDGETLWAETEIVAMGLTQVGKISLAALAELQAENSGISMDQSQMFMDPISQIEALVTAFDVAIVGVEGGQVTMSLTPTEETLVEMQSEMDELATVEGLLVLDEKTASPLTMSINLGPTMDIQLGFTGFAKVDPSDIEEDTFSYTPPPGSAVMDMEPLLRSGM